MIIYNVNILKKYKLQDEPLGYKLQDEPHGILNYLLKVVAK